jgi:ubiquinone/menaquinone biosynthesis C-methylase UbiE
MNVFEAMKGFSMYHCLYVGLSTGIFSCFNMHSNSGLDIDIICHDAHLYEPFTKIWLDTALAFGVLEYSNEKYFVSQECVPFLMDDKDVRYQGDLIRIFVDHLSQDMRNQPDHMRSGAYFPFSNHASEFVELISKRGYLRAKTFITSFIQKNKAIEDIFSSTSIILDIGCGSGSFIKGLSESYAHPKYIGIDEDRKSIELAKLCLKENQSFYLGQIEGTDIPYDIDCITMILALHEIDSKNRLSVLKKCFSRLAPGGYLLVMEFPYPDDKSEFSNPKFLMGTLDQYFEMTWGTEHIGWSDQKKLIENAGFHQVTRYFLDDGIYMTISAIKPKDNINGLS